MKPFDLHEPSSLRDAIALLDHLGLDRVAWCGVSIGGMIGLWLAARAAELLQAAPPLQQPLRRQSLIYLLLFTASWKRLADFATGCTQEELARRLQLDRSTVSNLIRLLELPAPVQQAALQWSLQRGSRSGRVAWQFARDWAGKHDNV